MKKLIYRISAAIVVAGITRWHMVCCTMAAFAFHDRNALVQYAVVLVKSSRAA